jgi:hypothetical protein
LIKFLKRLFNIVHFIACLFLANPANAANQRAARTAYTIRLDSTQNIPPRICRLPAHVVKPRITVAGDIYHKKTLLWQSAALALLLICT